MFEQSQRLQEKLYILAQIIQTVSDANDMKTAAPMLTKSQFQLLNIISMSGGRTVSELADLLGISKPAISKTVDRLVHHLLVTRTEDSQDRRTIHLTPTAVGEGIIKNYQQRRNQRLEDLESHFSLKEMAQFEQLIDTYIHRCVVLDEEMELICVQCNSQYEDQCQFKAKSGQCRYKVRVGQPR